MIYYLLFFLCVPVFLLYSLCCFIFPLIKFGKKITGGEICLYIIKDPIHSDYLFDSNLFDDIFPKQKKFIKIGWGDRKIFLETKSWSELKIKDFLYAFFGLNETVLRVDFLEKIPANHKVIKINKKQFEIIKEHIKKSYYFEIIKKNPDFYQIGEFYKSNLNYNCITNCNNWVNVGLIKCKASNRIWCPLSFWI